MIDLHCHILPGVDDGPEDWESALAMMAQAAETGTRVMVATPHSHHLWRADLPCVEIIQSRVADARELVAAAGLPLEILARQELHADPRLPEELARGAWLPLGGSRTLLMELPFAMWPPFTESLLFDLQLAGYTVLLAHPERYRAVQEDPNLLLELVQNGLLTQVTSTSILGRFGERPRVTARLLVEHGLAHVLSSDAHTTRGRHPRLDEALAEVSDWIGEEAAQRLVEANPRALLEDREVEAPEPQPVAPRRKKLFGLF